MFTRRTVRVAWNSSPSVLTVLVIVLQHHCRCCGKLFCDDCSRDRVVLPSEYGAVVAEQLSTAATVVLQHDDEHGQHRRYRGVPCDTYPAAGEHRELSVAQLVIGNHFWAHHPRVAHDLTVGRRNTIICSLQGLHRDWLLRLG